MARVAMVAMGGCDSMWLWLTGMMVKINAAEEWLQEMIVPATHRVLDNFAWVTSENFLTKAWLQKWGTLPTICKQEFINNTS